MDGVRAEVTGDPDSAEQQVDAAGAIIRLRVQEGGAVLATRVKDIAGAGLEGDVQPEGVQSVREVSDADGEVRGERVEVHVVERQSDTVVAEVGEQGEGVVEAEIGEAVRAVAETERERRRGRG